MKKARGGDGMPVEIFQILKDEAVKVLHLISANFENSPVATGLERSLSLQFQRKAISKNVQLPHIALISHAIKAIFASKYSTGHKL